MMEKPGRCNTKSYKEMYKALKPVKQSFPMKLPIIKGKADYRK